MRKGITNRVRRYCYRRFSFPVTPGKVSFGDLFSKKFGTESPTCGFPLILLALPGFVH